MGRLERGRPERAPPQVVQNARFALVPALQGPNLASHVLARLEESQLGTARKLEACLGIDLVVAWRIFHLTRLGRGFLCRVLH